jgi:hypothetical protein
MYLGYVSIISQSQIICTTSHSNRLGLDVKCWVTFGPAFTLYPLFRWYPQSKEILLNLSMKCWNSVFNAQGSRVIIVVVQVGALKIFVHSSRGGALRTKERQDEAQFIWHSLQRHIYLTQFPYNFPPNSASRERAGFTKTVKSLQMHVHRLYAFHKDRGSNHP